MTRHLLVTVSPLDKAEAIYRLCAVGFFISGLPGGQFEVRSVEERDLVEKTLAQAGIAFTVEPLTLSAPEGAEVLNPNEEI